MRYFFVLIVATALLAGCKRGIEEEALSEIVRPVKYEKVIRAGGKGVVTFSGVAQSGKEAKLSFRVAGTIRSMNVKLGDRVSQGQLIASIDPSDYTLSAEQAVASLKGSEASMQSSETQLIIARANYKRIEKLYESNSIPLSEFEQAKSNYETAQSGFEASKTSVTSATKQVEAARNQVNYTRLTAPFSGVITAVQAEANELVGSGTPVAVLSTEALPEVNVGIPENLISKVKKNMEVLIAFSALPGQTFKGTVEEVSYAAGSSPTYPAIIRIKEPSEEIRPGMAASVTFNLTGKEEESFLVCPVSAVGEDEKSNFVFVLEADTGDTHKAMRRTVEIGELLPSGFEVLNGLKEGDLVATAGLRSLLNGMKVTLMENR